MSTDDGSNCTSTTMENCNVESQPELAVHIRHAFKFYGSRKKERQNVLNNLNMTVQKGKIYGLLGASGCGKTTLLSCIVGCQRLNVGEIWVLGGTPGTRQSAAPGPCIGYMPQQNALYEGFTIEETLKFFGWLSGLNSEQISQRMTDLQKLLELPAGEYLVKNLSGGGKRRTSLALTLLSDPQLVILDEPTVGTDAVVRDNIWTHLKHLTQRKNVTVIISTHYIEEAKLADTVGLMRGGYLLAEEDPNRLIQSYGARTLEDVFLKLCYAQSKMHQGTLLGSPIDPSTCNLKSRHTDKAVSSEKYAMINVRHMKALLWKNAVWTWRNRLVVGNILLLPTIVFLIFGLTIGNDPDHIKATVVNFEQPYCGYDFVNCTNVSLTALSCAFLQLLTNDIFELEHYEQEQNARHKVQTGAAWLMLIIPKNFSQSVRERVEFQTGTLYPVEVYQDSTVQIVALLAQRRLYKLMMELMRLYAHDIGVNRKIVEIPIRLENPIYGSDQITLLHYMAPGLATSIIFFLALSITCVTLFVETGEQIMDRLIAHAVPKYKLLLSHMFTQLLVLVFQCALLLLVALNHSAFAYHDEIFSVVFIVLLSGVMGICLGLFLSSILSTENTVLMTAVGCMFPLVLLSGIFWPLEAMHWSLQKLAPYLPLTDISQSLRLVVTRGWSLTHPHVYSGVLVSVIWSLISLVIALVSFTYSFNK